MNSGPTGTQQSCVLLECAFGIDIYSVSKGGARSWGLFTFLGWEKGTAKALLFGNCAKQPGAMVGCVCV